MTEPTPGGDDRNIRTKSAAHREATAEGKDLDMGLEGLENEAAELRQQGRHEEALAIDGVIAAQRSVAAERIAAAGQPDRMRVLDHESDELERAQHALKRLRDGSRSDAAVVKRS